MRTLKSAPRGSGCPNTNIGDTDTSRINMNTKRIDLNMMYSIAGADPIAPLESKSEKGQPCIDVRLPRVV